MLGASRVGGTFVAVLCVACSPTRNATSSAAPDFVNAAFAVSESSTVSISGNTSDPAHQLAGVRSAALMASGRVVVLPEGVPEAWQFDGNGEFVRSIGRRGEGPGEFRVPKSIHVLRNDDILVYDEGLRRVAQFDSTGSPSRTLDDVAKAVCCFGNGAFLFEPTAPRGFSFVEPDPRDTSSPPIPFGLVQPTDRVIDRTPIVSLPRTKIDFVVISPDLSGWSNYPRPFARRTSVVIAGDEIVYGDAAAFAYSIYSMRGERLRTISVPYEQKPVSKELLSRLRTAFISYGDDRAMEAKHQRIFDATPFPSSEPAYTTILAEEDGTVWVRRYESEFRESDWWVRFDRSGRMTGTLKTPASHDVLRFTRGHVILARDNDSTGLSLLQVRPIRKK
jgi:hypothetical protein